MGLFLVTVWVHILLPGICTQTFPRIDCPYATPTSIESFKKTNKTDARALYPPNCLSLGGVLASVRSAQGEGSGCTDHPNPFSPPKRALGPVNELHPRDAAPRPGSAAQHRAPHSEEETGAPIEAAQGTPKGPGRRSPRRAEVWAAGTLPTQPGRQSPKPVADGRLGSGDPDWSSGSGGLARSPGASHPITPRAQEEDQGEFAGWPQSARGPL